MTVQQGVQRFPFFHLTLMFLRTGISIHTEFPLNVTSYKRLIVCKNNKQLQLLLLELWNYGIMENIISSLWSSQLLTQVTLLIAIVHAEGRSVPNFPANLIQTIHDEVFVSYFVMGWKENRDFIDQQSCDQTLSSGKRRPQPNLVVVGPHV